MSQILWRQETHHNQTRPLRRWGRIGICCLIFLSSCVLPEDKHAESLQEIPPELFVTTTEVPTTTEPEPDESFELALFWHDENGGLVEITRLLETPPTFDDALEHLVLGPNQEEVLLDGAVITPRVVAALDPVARLVDNNVLVITVADEFLFREREDQKIPITEELVCTMTGLSGIAAIRIEDSLGEIALTNVEASPIDAATRSDFADCVPVAEEPDPEAPTEETDPEASTEDQGSEDG